MAAIVLAAGKSTRMKTNLPKVMHEMCGRPMLAYVLDACRDAGVGRIAVVVGFGKEAVIAAFLDRPDVQFVEQAEQHGTGHAVSMCTSAFEAFRGDLLVIAGDMPMVHAETLKALLDSHRRAGSAASIATTVLQDPTGYGRIIRDAQGRFERIVEHRDCDARQLEIHEVNPSYYCFDAQALFAALPKLQTDNAKGEYYVTDALTVIRQDGGLVSAMVRVPSEDAVGINSRTDLADVAGLMQRRIQAAWLEQGVVIVSPANTWIDSRARIGVGATIKPFTYIEGAVRIGKSCTIGPFAYLADGTVVEDGAAFGPSGSCVCGASAAGCA